MGFMRYRLKWDEAESEFKIQDGESRSLKRALKYLWAHVEVLIHWYRH